VTEGLAPTPTEGAVDALGTRLWWVTPPIAALLAATLAELRVGHASLQVEEAGRVAVARASVGAIWDTARADDMTHLTTHLVWKGWLGLAGTSEEAVRYPAVIFAALAAGLAVLVGKELAGWVAGAIAGGVLATSSFVLGAAVTADGTTLALLLVLLSTYALLRAARSDHSAWWALYAVAMVATTTVDLASATVVLAHVAYLALLRPERGTRAAAAVGIVAIADAAYLALVSRSRAWSLDWLPDLTGRAIADALWSAVGHNPVMVAAAVAGLAAVALGPTTAPRLPSSVLLGAWLVGPVAATLLVSLWRPAFATDYLVAAVAAAALLAGVAVQAAYEARARITPAAVGAAGVAIVVGGVLSVTHFLRQEEQADWRGASRYVLETRKGPDAVLVTPGRHAPVFSYYAPDVQVADAPAGDAVWVVASGTDPDTLLRAGREAVGAPAYALLEERSFGDTLMVQRWARP
jgi:mannosyltransferase